MIRMLAFLLCGVFFGFTLSRVGASDYDLIYALFALTNLKLAWVIITAIIVGHLGMRWLHSRGDLDYLARPIDIKEKSLNWLTPLGGILFGAGWAITGACPGTALAQLGEGKILGLFTVLGIIGGTYIYARLMESGVVVQK